MRADKRFFQLNYRSSICPDGWGIISDVKVDEGITIIAIRSILQVSSIIANVHECPFFF